MITEALAFTAAASAACAAWSIGLRALRLPRPRGRVSATRLAGGALGAAAGLLVGVLLPGRLGTLAALGTAAAGVLWPQLAAVRSRRREHERARRDLPALLDLLCVSVEAGSSLPQALAEVGARSQAPLARRWAAIAAQVRLGVPLHDALERHRRDVAIAEVESFTAALQRAARHGAPLSDTLAAQASAARRARRRLVQERAARAAPKMQLVVALLLVPSVMLLVAAALLSALAGGGSGAFLTF